jgi:prevent-host-death family protein
MTKHWALQDAKARLSELVRASAKEPQHISVRGEPAAVLISASEYDRLKGGARKSTRKPMTLLEALQACPYELQIPARKREPPRDIGL